jgi:hypothetical protein
MNKGQTIVFFAGCLLLLLPDELKGQPGETDRKWALRYAGDVMIKPVLTSNPSKASTGRGGSGFRLQGELYLPGKWALEAGYFNSDVSYGNASRQMEGLQAGVRKYFLASGLFVQPYVSAAGEINWGRHSEHGTFGGGVSYGETFQGMEKTNGYTGTQSSVNPRLSFVPGVGVELYLFSSVAFTAEYRFNLGIASHTAVETVWNDGRTYALQDRGMHHAVSLGVKVSFPFSFTSDDGTNLLYILSELLFGALDRRWEESNQYRW